jgi:hypothetical protein
MGEWIDVLYNWRMQNPPSDEDIADIKRRLEQIENLR